MITKLLHNKSSPLWYTFGIGTLTKYKHNHLQKKHLIIEIDNDIVINSNYIHLQDKQIITNNNVNKPKSIPSLLQYLSLYNIETIDTYDISNYLDIPIYDEMVDDNYNLIQRSIVNYKQKYV